MCFAIRRITVRGLTLALLVSSGLPLSGCFWMNEEESCGEPYVQSQPPTAEVLAEEQRGPTSVVADTQNVYWISDTRLRSIPVDGGDVTTHMLDDIATGELVADEDAVYVGATDAIVRVPKNGGDPERIASDLEGQPRSLAMDASFVYWTDGGAITRVSKDGGPPSVVVPGSMSGFDRLAISDGHVYWTNYSSGDGTVPGIFTADLADGVPHQLTAATFAYGLAADRGEVFWVGDDLEVRMVDEHGLERVVAPGHPEAVASFGSGPIALDDTHVYIGAVARVSRKGGELYRVTVAGGPASMSVSGLAIQGDRLFFAAFHGSDGITIERAAKDFTPRMLCTTWL